MLGFSVFRIRLDGVTIFRGAIVRVFSVVRLRRVSFVSGFLFLFRHVIRVIIFVFGIIINGATFKLLSAIHVIFSVLFVLPCNVRPHPYYCRQYCQHPPQEDPPTSPSPSSLPPLSAPPSPAPP